MAHEKDSHEAAINSWKAAEKERDELKKENQCLKNSDKAMLDTIAKMDKEHEARVKSLTDTSLLSSALADSANELVDKLRIILKSFEQATMKHSLENIRTMMSAMPEPEDLEGLTVAAVSRWSFDECGKLSVGVVQVDLNRPIEYLTG